MKSLFQTIKDKYPNHRDQLIRDFIENATEFDQPLTLEEYEDWLTYLDE